MSALQFIHTPNSGENCCTYGCVARCRYIPMIAGWVDLEDRLCGKHKAERERNWVSCWDVEIAKDLVAA